MELGIVLGGGLYIIVFLICVVYFGIKDWLKDRFGK